MKQLIFIFCLLFVFTTNAFAQDVPFANTNQSLLYTNPSFAGSNGGLRVQSVYNNQNLLRYLNGRESNFSNYYYLFNTQNSIDAYIKKLHGALALNYTNIGFTNKYSTHTSQNVGLTYAQHFKIKNFKIIPSVQFSFIQNRQVYKDAFYEDMKHWDIFLPYTPPPRVIKSQGFDVSTGLLFQYKNFYGGVSAFHLNRPDIALWGSQPTPIFVNIHASQNIILSEKFLLNFFMKMSFSEMDFNSLRIAANALFFKHFIYGIGVSGGNTTTDNVMMLAGYRANYFSATIGYGINNMSALFTERFRHTWELALSFNLRDKENRNTLTAFEAW